ncbi:Flp pilus assembly complex ATPase component TadA [Oscillochloris sp. ZM17-4]|uniref:CpaF family protein n=1 Tax=Oscillochloris sp. ZM17-4 TaxID=2866714 RepID=UPI001C73CB59|nr:ATPase, T2SS/T4P/T4SS family [Oscillochloris sp. ZM17-4]MBX0330025.1 Flp pilus assembly complex ATPase component TadA [Oscillochloris sp. ZM17-4]
MSDSQILAVAPVDSLLRLVRQLRAQVQADPTVQTAMDDGRWQTDRQVEQHVRALISTSTLTLLASVHPEISSAEQQPIATLLGDDLVGFGPLEVLFADSTISEIMVNGAHDIFVEQRGRLRRTDVVFEDDQHALRIITRIAAACDRQLSPLTPAIDGHLPNGFLIHAVIPPVAMNGPSATIRRMSLNRLKIDDLIRFGAITPEMAELLRACIVSRCNILISGGVGSGKMTLLGVLCNFIPEDERIVVIQDQPMLQLSQENLVLLESQPTQVEGRSPMTVRELVQMSRSMRAERVIIAELNGPECYDVLRMIDQGQPGTMMSIAANGPEHAVERLLMLIKLSHPDLPESYLRTLVRQSIDLVVQQTRLRDGQRKVTAIAEVIPAGSNDFELRPIWSYHQTGLDARGRVQGEIRRGVASPALFDVLSSHGFFVPPSVLPVPLDELGQWFATKRQEAEAAGQQVVYPDANQPPATGKMWLPALWHRLTGWLPGRVNTSGRRKS